MKSAADRASLQPESGVRYLLELQGDASSTDSQASYRGSVLLPSEVFEYTVTLSDDGTATLAAMGADAAEPMLAQLHMFARLTARGARGRRDDGLVVWPLRVTRWRPTAT